MSKIYFIGSIFFLLSACSSGEEPVANKTAIDFDQTTKPAVVADTVYTNAKIYTVNANQPWAEAVAIKEGKFIVVGSASDVESVIGDSTDVIDLSGAFAMPGIQENHVHATTAGATIDKAAGRLQFSPGDAPEEIMRALAEYAKANPGDGWIRGGIWGTEHFPNGQPHKSVIDAVISDRPVLFMDETAHGAWVNSKALELAGINADTPQPASGVIGKDPNTGEPTGYLADGGMTDVMKLIPQPTLDQWKQSIRDSQEVFHSFGITSITDAAAGNRETLDAYNSLEAEGGLKMRVDYVIILNDYMADIVEPLAVIADREQYSTRLLDPGRAKIGADGVPISGASLLLEPYTNNPDSYGKMVVSEEQLTELMDTAGQGMQLMIHAIGDGTIRKALDTIEAAREKYPENTRPAQIAHPIWAHPDDIPRFRDLNVIAEVSPPQYFWTPLAKGHVPVLGDERMQRTMPIRDFLDADVIVSYGSDWPAGTTTPNPWRHLEGMVTRMNPDGDYPGEILGEPITLEEALKIFTINGAISMEHDNVTGSIEVGKYADMVILDNNPFDLVSAGQADKIGDMNATRTLFEGEVVFDSTD
ncbi:MAG: amidohydrolase [Planctomycetota bacterium]